MINHHFVSAGSFEQGLQFFAQKDYAQAEKIWQPLAEEGDARAQYNLALIFLKYKKDPAARNQLQKKNAAHYLAMSRAEGLVDGYFLNLPADDTAAKTDADNSTPLDSMSWINQQPKTNYTLQLATGKSRESMQRTQKKLLTSQQLEQSENVYIQVFKRQEQDKTVNNYVLLYGSFDSYQQAKNEVEKLPDALKTSSPWIRTFNKLQSKANVQQGKK